ncbi:MAG: DUF885 domain-containing protein [Opitutaceae bacterium]|nr:DUF885 domain-containing protein [Opitutaceae bacterium]
MTPRYLAMFSLLFSVSALAQSVDDAKFVNLAHNYLERVFRLHPEDATSLGDHRHDDRLSDYSPAAIAGELAGEQSFLQRLEKIDSGRLTGPNRVDARLLRDAIEAQIFTLTELQPARRDPLFYETSYAGGLYLLVARDFAPAEVRLRALAGRLRDIPRVLQQARGNLDHPPRVFTETAIERAGGAIVQILHGFDDLLAQAPSLKAELAPLQAAASAALSDYRDWLQQDLLPRSNGDFRIGADVFRRKLRFALASDLSMEEILQRAEADVATTTAALYDTARLLYREYLPQAAGSQLADRHHVIKTVLDRLADEHPTQDTVVARADATLREATDFVRKHDLVTLPTTPLQLIVMPEFKRGSGIAYCDGPGALEKNGETFYAISPTPQDWPEARQASFYREYNNYMLYDLTVHEAMPGHFLQGAHANQFHAPTLVRAVFQNGPFIEGWAVYCEQMMAEHGFGGPKVRMQQLKMRLRAALNAILDQKIHTEGMTEREALDLMMNTGFQEEGEAVGKWKRAQLTSTQLSTYFAGASEWLDLRASAQARDGAMFDLKRFNDTALSYGSPPVRYVRQLMGL